MAAHQPEPPPRDGSPEVHLLPGFDEYLLGLNPILLGGGNPLFKSISHNVPMKLLEARPLKTGCVLLRYQPVATT